jgi:hypothetical protein
VGVEGSFIEMDDDSSQSPALHAAARRGNTTTGQPVLPPEDDILPGFPKARRVKPKTPYAGGKRRRWKDPDGTIYEWDYQHGRVEKYNHRGEHLGEFDPLTGEKRKDANPDYRVEP